MRGAVAWRGLVFRMVTMADVKETIMEEQETPETRNDGARRRRTVVVAVVAVIVLVLAGLTWWAVATRQARTRLAAARESCVQAQADYAAARKTYEDASKDKTFETAVKIEANQVKDAKTVEALATARNAKAPASTVACPADGADAAQFEAASQTIREAGGWYAVQSGRILDASKKVVASRDAKNLSEAQAALDKSVADARRLYDSSKDKVADDKTRDMLHQRLDASGKMMDTKDIGKINAARAELDKTMAAVNDSVKAKEDADRQAAEETARQKAEAQAAQAQQNQASANTAPQQSYTPSYAPARQPAPQYTVPRPAAPAQPTAPAVPNTGGNSGGGPISGGHGCNESSCGGTPDLGSIPR